MIIIRPYIFNGRRHMIPAEPGFRTDGGTQEWAGSYGVKPCWPQPSALGQTGVQNHFVDKVAKTKIDVGGNLHWD